MREYISYILYCLIAIGLFMPNWLEGSCGSNVGIGIPHDNSYVSDTIFNNGSVGLLGTDVFLEEVCVLIDHNFIGNLEVLLTSPSGTEITLFLGDALPNGVPDYSITDDLGSVFSQTEVCFTPEVIVDPYIYWSDTNNLDSFYGSAIGNWTPYEGFDAFTGENVNGAWSLSVAEDTSIANYDGVFMSWSLCFSNGDCECNTGLEDINDVEITLDLIGLEEGYCADDPEVILTPYAIINSYWPNETSEDYTFISDSDIEIPFETNVPLSTTIQVGSFPEDAILLNAEDIAVTFEIEHSWIGDLSIALEAPCGITIPLFDRPGFPEFYNPHGSFSDVFGEYTFTMTAEDIFPQTQIYDTIPPGDYLPEIGFENLLGCDLNGDWTLLIVDFGSGDTGVVNNWGIDLAFNIPEGEEDLQGDGVMTDTSQIIFNPALANIGLNEIVYVYEFTTGEVFSDTFTTIVHAVPELEEIDSLHLCFGENLNLEDLIPPEVNNLTGDYQWYYDEDLTMPIGNPNIVVEGDYYLEFISDFGCKTSEAFNLSIADYQYVYPDNTGPYCLGDTVELISNDDLLGESIVYLWQGPNAFLSTDPNPIILPEEAVEGEYTLYAIIDGCETPVGTTEISLAGLPAPSLLDTIIQPICSIDSVATYYLSQSYNTHNWEVDNGLLINGGYDGDSFIMIGWEGPGSFSVEVTNGNGCTSETITWEVPYYDLPNPGFLVSSNSVCSGETEVLYQLNANYDSIEWSIQNGEIVTQDGNYILVNWDNVTTVTQGSIGATLRNEIDCSVDFTQPITIYPIPEPLLTEVAVAVCAENEMTYTLDANYQEYEWNIEGGNIIDGGSNIDNYATVQWNDEAEGFITINVEQDNCEGSLMDSVIINNIITPEFDPTETELCLGTEGSIYTVEGDYDSYIWNVSGGLISDGGTLNDDFVQVDWTEENTVAGNIGVIVSNIHGCIDSVNFDIAINELPVINLTEPDTTVCVGETTAYLLAISPEIEEYVWEVEGGTLMNDSSLPEHEAMIIWDEGPGMASINITLINDKGCSISKSYNVQVNAMPEPEFVLPEEAVCVSNNEITYTLNNIWDYHEFNVLGGTVIDSTDNEITIQWEEVGEATIEALVADEFGCASTVTIDVNIAQEDSIAFINPITNLCVGNEIMTYEIPAGYDINDIQLDNGAIVSNDNSMVEIEWELGEGNLTLTTETPSGCIVHSETLIVNLVDVETLTFGQGSDQVCVESTGIQYSINESFETYTWNVDGGTIVPDGNPNDDNVTIDWGSNPVGNIFVIAQSLGDCETSIDLPIVINDLPIPTMDSPTMEVCANTTNVAYSLMEAYQAYDWNVIGGEIIGDSTEANIEVNWADGANGTVEVVVTDINGCQQNISENIQINALPVLDWDSQPMTICADFGEVTYQLSNDIFTDYTWNITNGTITEGGNDNNYVKIEWDNTQNNHNIELIVTNANNCSLSESFAIELIEEPALNFGGAAVNHCETEGAVMYELSEGFTNFIWTIDGGTAIDGGQANADFALIEWDGPGMGTINVIASNDFGCEAVTNIEVEIKAAINAQTVQANFQVCAGDTVNLSALGGEIYEWLPAIDLNQSNIADPFAVVQESRTYQVVVSELNGCNDTTSINIEIQPETSIEVISEPYEYCGIELLTMEATGNHYDNLTWSTNTPGTWSQANTLNPTFTPDDKEDKIVFTVAAEGFCGVTTDSIEFKAEDNPINVSLSEDLMEICQGDMVDLIATVEAPPGAIISWSGGNGLFENAISPNTRYEPQASDLGVFDLELRIESDCHSRTEIVNLMIHPNVTLDAGIDQLIYVGESVQLNGEGDPQKNYLWTPSEGLSCVDCSNPIASPTETTTYTLLSSSICTSDAKVTVTVDKSTKVVLPNAFSPNGDGLNDYFRPQGRGYELTSLMIFNRYGEKVFEDGDGTQGWDGIFNGENQPIGVYTYICEYVTYEYQLRKIKKGSITLIR